MGGGLYKGKQVQEERWGSCHWIKDTNSAKWGVKEKDRHRRVNSVQSVWTTPKQKLRKRRAAASLAGLLVSFSSGEQPNHKLPDMSCQRHLCWTRVTIFSYIYVPIFFTSIYFLHFVFTKTRLLNKWLKRKTQKTVLDTWPELLLWIYCFVHWVMFGIDCPLQVSLVWTSMLMVFFETLDFQLKAHKLLLTFGYCAKKFKHK